MPDWSLATAGGAAALVALVVVQMWRGPGRRWWATRVPGRRRRLRPYAGRDPELPGLVRREVERFMDTHYERERYYGRRGAAGGAAAGGMDPELLEEAVAVAVDQRMHRIQPERDRSGSGRDWSAAHATQVEERVLAALETQRRQARDGQWLGRALAGGGLLVVLAGAVLMILDHEAVRSPAEKLILLGAGVMTLYAALLAYREARMAHRACVETTLQRGRESEDARFRNLAHQALRDVRDHPLRDRVAATIALRVLSPPPSSPSSPSPDPSPDPAPSPTPTPTPDAESAR